MSIKDSNILGIGLTIVLILSACSTDTFGPQNDDYTSQIPIIFDTTQSRAEIQSNADIDQFSVWGWYQSGNEYTSIFDHTTVTHNNGWIYEGVQYWKENHLHHFYAVYPVSGISHATCTQSGQISISGFDASATNAAAVDLMFAQATDLLPSQEEVVSLVFQHVLSRVYISAKSDQPNTAITSIAIDGARTHGDYTNNDWHTETYPVATYSSNDTYNLNTDECILLRALTIPQTISQLDLSVKYKREGQESTGHIRLNNVKWTGGYSYKYLLTLNGDDIQLNITIDDSQLWQDGGDSDIEFN